MSTNSFLQVENLSKSFGDLTLFEGLTFGVNQGDKVGLIARNGAGKSTLLSVLAGTEPRDEGEITFRRDIRVGYLEQAPTFPSHLTVLEACFHSDSETVRTIAAYERALALDATDELAPLMERMDRLKAWDYEQRAKRILGKLNIQRFDQRVGELSGGQLKRVALANTLILDPDFLILDEPTNHLDLPMVEWLEDYLSKSHVTLLMVTHDRYFLDRVCSSILELDDRTLYAYRGNYSHYLEKRSERLAARNAEVDRARNLLRTELDWMRRQPQARGTKAKYRVDAFHALEEKARQRREEANVRLRGGASYIGNKIFEARHVTKRFGDLRVTDDFNYTFARYEKMGIIGNNGTGKSTFIKMLIGDVAPDSGRFEVGETVRFGYYSQEGLAFDERMKVIDVARDIAEYVELDGEKIGVSQFLNYFLFTPDKQYNYVRKLSGGEKRRLYLCTVLMRSPNFLVLDEPTNDLDIVTLNVLEEYLRTFKGCLIVVSHDRYFMDKVVDHLLVFHGDAEIQDFPGNYTQYREWREAKALMAQDSPKPTREERRPRPAREEKRRLTYKERKEYEALEGEIEALEAEKTALEEALSGGTLGNEELLSKSRRIAEVIELIDTKSTRWLELSEWA